MKKKYLFVFVIVLTMGMTACSSDSKESTVFTETITEREPENVSKAETKPDTAEFPKSDNIENAETEPTVDQENIESDPITGIVEKYADNTIIIKDPGDEIRYYFSTKNAQIVERDSPIAVGDTVEITYRGLLGDEKNPCDAVKIVADIVK